MVANQTLRYFIKIIKKEKALNKKEKEILIARLQKKTLVKIGKKYKLTAERIRQIEDDSVKKFLKKVNQLFLFE
ncbi:MAG: sigma factor-like helix-turn-helix DNA-binding protein [Patescibacteria group bacterium]